MGIEHLLYKLWQGVERVAESDFYWWHHNIHPQGERGPPLKTMIIGFIFLWEISRPWFLSFKICWDGHVSHNHPHFPELGVRRLGERAKETWGGRTVEAYIQVEPGSVFWKYRPCTMTQLVKKCWVQIFDHILILVIDRSPPLYYLPSLMVPSQERVFVFCYKKLWSAHGLPIGWTYLASPANYIEK